MFADMKTVCLICRTKQSILLFNGKNHEKRRGGSFQYYPVISRQYYGQKSVENIVSRNFGSSYKSLVSCLVHDEKITVDELRELIDLIKKGAE